MEQKWIRSIHAAAAVVVAILHATATSASDVILLEERVVRVQTEGEVFHKGTGFRLGRPDLIITARHVAEGCSPCVVSARRGSRTFKEKVLRIQYPPQPEADLAALILERSPHTWQYFSLMDKPAHELGQKIMSYGYPGVGRESTPRLMSGHVQRVYLYARAPYRYRAYELGFPAFRGQSGSPVFLDDLSTGARNNVLAVVTSSVTYNQDIRDLLSASASWAVGLPLFPYTEWIESIANEPAPVDS